VLWSSVGVAAVAIALPFVPALAATFGFVPLPPTLLALLLAITLAYIFVNEWAKHRFRRRFGL
jgi:Mg2+-importing ATPase